MSESAVGIVDQPQRKQQQRSYVTQRKLLDAATEAFSENGYKGTSTRDIAERAGVHHPLITYHFKNKNQLWRAAADRIFQDFRDSVIHVVADLPDTDPRARAESLIRAYVRYAYRNPALHKIVLQESSHPSDRLDWLVERHLRPVFVQLSAYFESLQSAGIAAPGDPALLINMMRVSAGGVLALSLEIKATSGFDFDANGAIDELADLIIRCFLPGDPTSPRQPSRDAVAFRPR